MVHVIGARVATGTTTLLGAGLIHLGKFYDRRRTFASFLVGSSLTSIWKRRFPHDVVRTRHDVASRIRLDDSRADGGLLRHSSFLSTSSRVG